jgi:tetratricopeptide (TPR) repeat protein
MTRAIELEPSMRETLDITEQDLDGLFERYRRSPESRVFVVLADACRKIDRIDEALEICEQGIGRHPEYASGYVVKGKCLYDLDRHDEAQNAFERVLDFDEDNLVALKYLGMMEARSGRYDSARTYLKRILRLDPENPEIMEALKHVDERRQLEDEDVPEPPPPEEPDRIVEFEVEGETTDEVMGDLEVSDELATITLADIYASQGYKEKALKIYEEVLARQPENQTIMRKVAGLTDAEADVSEEAFLDVDADGGSESDAQETGSARVEDERGDHTAGSADEALPGQANPEQEQDGETRATATRGKRGSEIDEGKNIDHFKQWLEGLHK